MKRARGILAGVIAAIAMVAGVCACAAAADPPTTVLRIAADPNNLPFTNQRLEGFENRIADLIARDLHAELRYVWRAQRRGFFRTAFQESTADLVLGVPAGFERALTTAPYYRSTYVFASRRERGLAIQSFDDPALCRLKIGVQLIGDDGMNPPPAHALASRGLSAQVTGFTVYGDYARANPAARIMDAVAAGDVDIAIVWGPLAGWYATRSSVPLTITPVSPAVDTNGLPFAFDIAMGVRRGNTALRDAIDAALARHRDEIDRILDDYGIPHVALAARAARQEP